MPAMRRILLGSPVRQPPEVLRAFLRGLEALRVPEGFKLDALFADDNDSQESSAILRSARVGASCCETWNVQRPPGLPHYVRAENGHQWTQSLVDHVARLRNDFIAAAIDRDAELLFLVDSDLVLHEETLASLLAARVDIISAVFWTRWRNTRVPMPNVWAGGQYEFDRGDDAEQPDHPWQAPALLRDLQRPGYHEVGGLGACTLISRSALLAGCNYATVEGVALSGEDRHFCLRARALGHSLYADTHHPIRHLYREREALQPVESTGEPAQPTGRTASTLRFCTSSAPGAVAAPRPPAPRPQFLRRSRDCRLLLLMVVRNEAGRSLGSVLRRAAALVDRVLVVDDASSDNTPGLAAEVLSQLGVPHAIVRREKSLFAEEWRSRLEAWQMAMEHDPDWVLALDADELIEPVAPEEFRTLIDQGRFDGVAFRMFDMWNTTHFREDEHWRGHRASRVLLARIDPTEPVAWPERNLHCGRLPTAVRGRPNHRTLRSALRIQHLGWATEADRRQKYERYMSLDPAGEWGSASQYASILDETPALRPWIDQPAAMDRPEGDLR